ncbi:Serine kinase spk-1 [Venustampulla echinocandica]|uniref:Serine kinase spk-1 n=1 Tax=Venustampulla echinocandica TaxID=2656787 RepID=A0A370TD75_9HELO|nr:Serine kinase spk-1 [Venustampulla echinocandica]RDL32412.1 Serine kinase spk-1 [Venustampulla echinocandica]
MAPSESIEYEWIDGVERLEVYEPGGYQPVMINDLLHDRYPVLDKLGYGVNISSPSLPRRESSIIRALSGSSSTFQAAHTAIGARDAIPSILDEFDIQGPNGTYACYTLAPAQGNLREASFSLFPIQVARALAAKLTTAVSFVHSQGFVHGVIVDIHLRNVLVKFPSTFDELSIDQFREKFGEPELIPISRVDRKPLPPNIPSQAVLPLYLGKKAQEFTLADARGLVLSDFGEAFAPATGQRLGKDCNTPFPMRAIEAVFDPDAPLSYPSDIWSLGTAIWEILGMKFIFSESETRDAIVAQQIGVLGSRHFPPSWQKYWEQLITEQMGKDE